MTITERLKTAALALGKELGNNDRGWMEAELLLSAVVQKDRTWILAHGEKQLTPAQGKRFDQLLKRRQKREPIAYLIGRWSFYGREFLTDKRALIPRPETELLVEEALKLVDEKTLVWDVGTGTGAIAIAMALGTKAPIVASDVSTKALTLAKQNAKRHKAKIAFLKADLLDANIQRVIERSKKPRLLVLANLPYLPLTDKTKLDKDVTKYEPTSALFTKEHGNFLIHKLFKQCSRFPTKPGTLLTILAEFDPPQAETLKRLANDLFPNARVTIHDDLCGRPRVLSVRA